MFVVKIAGLSTTFPQIPANFQMKPKKSPQQNRQQDLFRSELSNMINPNHPLVKIAKNVDWDTFDKAFGKTYCPTTVAQPLAPG
jgi:hypothetical protein